MNLLTKLIRRLFNKDKKSIEKEKGAIEYIDQMSKQLNGQLRGGINEKAREENLALIQTVMGMVYSHVYSLGITEGYYQKTNEELKRNGIG